ncbi:MAG TPA: Crp/Fnr family transcriptional regulator [Nitrospira sp.]|nr:Crp/Fnr family transcriptional regulator [Nitrospira sp.]
MTQAFWHVRNCSLFQRLTESQLARLEQQARLRKFPRGAAIYLPHEVADAALLLAEGRVRIVCNTPEGKQSILALIEPGELFGELAIVDSAPREERAEAMTSSTVVFLPGAQLRQLMEECSGLALGVTKLIGLRRKRVERRLRSLLFLSNRERLTQLLVDLAEQYGNPTTAGIELSIRLSHQDLASIIGATRETVTTVLGELQGEGLVLIGRQKLVLLDLPRLASSGNSTQAALTSVIPPTPVVPTPHKATKPVRATGKASR